MVVERKSLEESIAVATPEDRLEALATLTGTIALDQQPPVPTPVVVPRPVFPGRTRPVVQPQADPEPVKADGTVKHVVVGSAYTWIDGDGNYQMAPTGTEVLVSDKSGKRGVDLGVLDKA